MGPTSKAYAVLGVAPGATAAEIKAAYRERARRIHPDRFADDPRRAQAAHEAFVELSSAFRCALAASAAAAAAAAAASAASAASAPPCRAAQDTQPHPPQPHPQPINQATPHRIPAQRIPVQARTAAPPRPSGSRKTGPRPQQDPMLVLLTLPQRCARSWTAAALEVWALTLVPEARQHLTAARRTARAAGVRSDRHLSTATAHALLTLTVNGLNGPRVMGVLGQLDDAYDALEIVLPREVVDGLPVRLTARRGGGAESDPDSGWAGDGEEPGRALLAFFAAAGALGAATAWTHFFGFFAG